MNQVHEECALMLIKLTLEERLQQMRRSHPHLVELCSRPAMLERLATTYYRNSLEQAQ